MAIEDTKDENTGDEAKTPPGLTLLQNRKMTPALRMIDA
jgi:hypothetical protein